MAREQRKEDINYGKRVNEVNFDANIEKMILQMNWTVLFLVCSWLVTASIAANPEIALPGCSDRCGDVIVPYPFGIDFGRCSKSFSFFLICNRTTNPATLTFIGFPVLSISPEQGLMLVSLETSYRCYNSSESATFDAYDFISSPLTPYKFSHTRNKFVTLGCDTLAYIIDQESASSGVLNFTTGCVSLCQGTPNILEGTCSGVGCCQTQIVKGLKLVSVRLTSSNNGRVISGINQCNYAFLVDQDSFNATIATDLSQYNNKPFRTTVSLDWFVNNRTCAEAILNVSEYACGPNAACFDSTNGPGHLCSCKDGFNGNPYLPRGCQDIDECAEPLKYPCQGSCRNTVGNYTCKCPLGMRGDGKLRCRGYRIATMAIGISLSFGLMLLIAGMFLVAKFIKKKSHVRLKKKYFEINGGMLFEQQVVLNNGRIQKAKIFSAEELEKATDHYNENRVLGKGGQGTVYKGMLVDGTTVAVKRSSGRVEEGQTEQFINEVLILSQINHKHVVKLLGCCLETQVPLLVYEFISNGTLSNHLHNPKREFALRWSDRIRIAREIAGALAYLHSSVSMPIYHRDIKTGNILIDEKLGAKVADFGISRSISSEKTHLTTLVQGTFGYLDPEYFQTNQYTDKSDVYSFGVVLVELLTGQRPITGNVTEESRGLAGKFMSAMEEECLFDVLDSQVIEEGGREEVIIVAKIAKQCLNLSGKNRPTMVEVALELENWQRTQKSIYEPQHFQEEHYFSMELSSDWDTVTRSEIKKMVEKNELELALLNNDSLSDYKRP